MKALLWTLAFLLFAYLEGTGLFPAWMPDLGIALLLSGTLLVPGFLWVAFLGGLLRGGLFGWMHFPLLHVGFVLVDAPLRYRLNFESLSVRAFWFLGWGALLGVLFHSGFRGVLGGGIALVLSFFFAPPQHR